MIVPLKYHCDYYNIWYILRVLTLSGLVAKGRLSVVNQNGRNCLWIKWAARHCNHCTSRISGAKEKTDGVLKRTSQYGTLQEFICCYVIREVARSVSY